MSDAAMFEALGFHWDTAAARGPVDVLSVQEVLADFDRGMAAHVWAAAALEGNPFTYPEVQTLLEGVTVGGRKVSDAQQILRLRDGYVLLRNMVASGDFALTKATSDLLHAAIASGEALESGGGNLSGIYASGLEALEHAETPFERAAAYFLFGADTQFYFDGNKRTARAMMNGVLMSAGIHAVLIPAQLREEFNTIMRDFYADRDATQAMELFAECGPRVAQTKDRLIRINHQSNDPSTNLTP